MQCRSCAREIGFGESIDNGICEQCRGGARRGRGMMGAGVSLLIFSVRLLSHGNIGVVLLVLGLVVFVMGIAAAAKRTTPTFQQDVDQGPDGPEQAVGKACSACEQKILSVFEATRCEKCDAPCHEECMHKHLVAAHSGSKKHPYRK